MIILRIVAMLNLLISLNYHIVTTLQVAKFYVFFSFLSFLFWCVIPPSTNKTNKIPLSFNLYQNINIKK
jgi:hypothetical protein